MSEPWLTDPKYGGMTPEAARRSHEGWVRQGCHTLPAKEPAASPAEVERFKRSVEVQLREYEEAIAAAAEWGRGWLKQNERLSRGFRAAARRRDGGR